jgi:hypothetical protein
MHVLTTSCDRDEVHGVACPLETELSCTAAWPHFFVESHSREDLNRMCANVFNLQDHTILLFGILAPLAANILARRME